MADGPRHASRTPIDSGAPHCARARGLKLLAKQEALIAELNQQGHDTEGARAVLVTMMETQSSI